VTTIDLRAAAREHMPRLSPSSVLIEAARATWLGRAANEYVSSTVFEGLAPQIEAAGMGAEAVRACEQFADEERRHGVLCAAVVEALGGEAIVELQQRPPFPKHEGAQPIEAALRSMLSISCLSETVAVALIGAEREDMPDGELRELLTSIWADEIGHARFGWMLVGEHAPSLDAATRERLSRYLAKAFVHLEEHELAHLPHSPPPPEGGAALGLCSGTSARALFYDTVAEVIVPRLDALGLAATRAWVDRKSVSFEPRERLGPPLG
jgi:hypothetical protein